MGIISSIYNSGYNIKRLFLGEQELKLAYLGEQIVFNEVIDDLNYVLYEFYKGKTISNTIEAPVKRAILKGQTMVNYAQITSHNFDENRTPTQNLNKSLEKGKSYTIIMNIVSQTATTGITTHFSKNKAEYTGIRNFNGVGLHKYLFTATTDFNQFAPYIDIGEYQAGLRAEYNQLMILEGDYTNVDIPYFEGMQSVKMPVLTTSNEDGTKTNILTVNEDVVLRGVGEVRDTLDLMTGEVVERIGEVIFDGSVDENWELWATYPEESAIFKLSKENSLKLMKEFDKSGVFKCDKFSTVLTKSLINSGAYHPHAISFFGSDFEYIQLRVYKSLLKSIDVTGLREYLINEPITVQYTLATESVKTVDLTMVDQDEQTISKLNSFNGTTHVSTEVAENSIYPTIAIEVATE